jgi:DNA polymerase-3 subunit beta
VRLNIDPGPARGVQQCRTGRGRDDIDYGGDAIEIGFNVTYSIDALANMSQDMVKIELADSNSSAF